MWRFVRRSPGTWRETAKGRLRLIKEEVSEHLEIGRPLQSVNVPSVGLQAVSDAGREQILRGRAGRYGGKNASGDRIVDAAVNLRPLAVPLLVNGDKLRKGPICSPGAFLDKAHYLSECLGEVVPYEDIGTDPERVTFRYYDVVADDIYDHFPDGHAFKPLRERPPPGVRP